MAHANTSVRNEVRKGEDFGETGLEVRAVGRGPRVQKVASRHGCPLRESQQQKHVTT